jgi:hypothetical protein
MGKPITASLSITLLTGYFPHGTAKTATHLLKHLQCCNCLGHEFQAPWPLVLGSSAVSHFFALFMLFSLCSMFSHPVQIPGDTQSFYAHAQPVT